MQSTKKRTGAKTQKFTSPHDPSVAKIRKRPGPETFRYIVLVKYRDIRSGKFFTICCVNLYQQDSGHPSRCEVMSWQAAEYTMRELRSRNQDPETRYTIHKVNAPLQREPRR